VIAGNNRGLFVYDVEYVKVLNNLVVDNHVGVHLSAGSTRNEGEPAGNCVNSSNYTDVATPTDDLYDLGERGVEVGGVIGARGQHLADFAHAFAQWLVGFPFHAVV